MNVFNKVIEIIIKDLNFKNASGDAFNKGKSLHINEALYFRN
jgi:hypothetical protein